MRRAANIDRNQPEIVKYLREVGATVQILSAVGKGCPDLLVGYHGWLFLFEVKDPDQPPNKRALTDDQVKWHAEWKGQACVILDWMEALRIMQDHVRQYGAR